MEGITEGDILDNRRWHRGPIVIMLAEADSSEKRSLRFAMPIDHVPHACKWRPVSVYRIPDLTHSGDRREES